MAKKISTIQLGYGMPSKNEIGVYDYVVNQITDSVEFHPRQILTKAQVDVLCKSDDWKVTVVKIGF